MTKHTPGPWTCTPGLRNDAEYCVYDKDGDFLTDGDLEHEANARLIAAAPDLLGALEAMVLNMRADGHEYRDCFNSALAAIAKARGE